MNAIQTFWTPPGLPAEQIHGGWLDPRFHLMGWALSASLLDQHFPRTILHTDSNGSRILTDLLELPYDEVHLTQEGMDEVYAKNWWVLRKISSYAHPDGPFLHVDGDAFLWNGLPQAMREKPVVVQNDQSGFQCYDIAVKQLSEAGIPLPHFFNGQPGPYKAVNMGIVGGTSNAFFKDYVNEVRSFFDQYLSRPIAGTTNFGFLNTLIEECFFRHYAEYRGQPIAEFIPVRPDQGYGPLANCMDESFGLTHLIGTNKKDIYFCKQVEFQLKRRFPKTFQKVVRLIENNWNKTAFTLPVPAIFPESNIMVGQVYPGQTVDMENCRDLEVRFREAGKEELSDIIAFEYRKHHLFQDLLSQSEMLHQDQQERLAKFDRHVRLNPDTVVVVNERIPVMNFRYPGKTNAYYLATVYDFAFGYRHIAHRPLDDLSIFVMVAAENPVTVASLIKLLIGKTPKAIDANQRARLLHKLDLKIKELLFLGLIDYQFKTEDLCTGHAIGEAAGV